MIFLAGCVLASWGGAEAISLWFRSSSDAGTIKRVAELTRQLQPLSVGCGFMWMALHILAEPMLKFQLPDTTRLRWRSDRDMRSSQGVAGVLRRRSAEVALYRDDYSEVTRPTMGDVV